MGRTGGKTGRAGGTSGMVCAGGTGAGGSAGGSARAIGATGGGTRAVGAAGGTEEVDRAEFDGVGEEEGAFGLGYVWEAAATTLDDVGVGDEAEVAKETEETC